MSGASDWTERHRPTSEHQLEGNDVQRRKIREWLDGWVILEDVRLCHFLVSLVKVDNNFLVCPFPVPFTVAISQVRHVYRLFYARATQYECISRITYSLSQLLVLAVEYPCAL